MKTIKFLALFLAALMLLVSFVACDGADNDENDGAQTSGTESTTEKDDGKTNASPMDGTYKTEYTYGNTTFIIEGTDITCIIVDTYYNNTFTDHGTITMGEGEEANVGRITWNPEESEDGTPSYRKFTFNPTDKTIVSATDFNTYTFTKIK